MNCGRSQHGVHFADGVGHLWVVLLELGGQHVNEKMRSNHVLDWDRVNHLSLELNLLDLVIKVSPSTPDDSEELSSLLHLGTRVISQQSGRFVEGYGPHRPSPPLLRGRHRQPHPHPRFSP